MASNSKIEWTEQTWNPIVGCSIVSPGCTNCYAMAMAARIDKMTMSSHYEGLTKKVNGKSVWTGKLAIANDHIFLAPLRRRKPTIYFVNSMGDLFHEGAPDEWIDQVFAVMALTPWHTYQVLTKRAERMRSYALSAFERLATSEAPFMHPAGKTTICKLFDWSVFRMPLPNVWLGVSAERQQEADERIPHLLQTPAAVRFISAEPLLGPIDLQPYLDLCHAARDGDCYATSCPQLRDKEPERSGRHCPLDDWDKVGEGETPRRLDWIIVGGESGPGARRFEIEWAQSIVDQCKAASIPCFVKQLGSKPFFGGYAMPMKNRKGGDPSEWMDGVNVRQMPGHFPLTPETGECAPTR